MRCGKFPEGESQMAVIKSEVASGFSSLPPVRQVGLMVGLAASVAIGVAVVLWSQKPTFSLLYGHLADQDLAEVLEALDRSQIPYELDAASGAVLVPADDVYQARLKLAREGLPRGGQEGFALLEKKQELGTSQFMEQARYQRALELELARSIASIEPVKHARVHLALPKRSVFLRRNEAPSASVVLELYGGRRLQESQIAALVHLVSASVPNLAPEKVAVVDQTGRLLSRPGDDDQFGLTRTQFEHARKLEQDYARRIVSLLEPIVGRGRVRAQVAADLDFTYVEQTRESFDPDGGAVRSERLEEDRRTRGDQAAGVPGALSNQPPEAGTLEGIGDAGATAVAEVLSDRRRTTRNYELDRTISHTRSPVGQIRKLSVAVLIDHRQIPGKDGQVQRVALSPEEMKQIEALVREAVGYRAERGDTVNVVNTSFQAEELPEELPPPPLWQQPWVWSLGKQAGAAVLVLLLIFGVLRPIMRSLAARGAAAGNVPAVEGPGDEGEGGGEETPPALPPGQARPQLEGPDEYQQKLEAAKAAAGEDPARVAAVIKTWMATDGG